MHVTSSKSGDELLVFIQFDESDKGPNERGSLNLRVSKDGRISKLGSHPHGIDDKVKKIVRDQLRK